MDQRVAALLLGFFVCGCASLSPPPSLSLAKFAQPRASEEPARGRVTASTSAVHAWAESGQAAFAFIPDSALSLFFDRYQFAVAAGWTGLSLEGNLSLVQADTVALGLLHGVSGVVVGSSADLGGGSGVMSSFELNGTVGGGVMLQLRGEKGVGFLAGRYAYATSIRKEGLASSTATRPTHYIVGSVGYLHTFGRFSISPELHFAHGISKQSGSSGPSKLSILQPQVSVSAQF